MAMRLMAVFALVALVIAAPSARASDSGVTAFVYYQDPKDNSQRNDYAWRLLAEALDHTRATYGPFTLSSSSVSEEQPNANSLLNAIGGVNVSVFAAPMPRRDKIIPVRFPIDRGLLGFRVLEIRQEDQVRFDHIAGLEDLKAMRIGSMGFWADTAIMRDAGLTVATGASFEGLFKMMRAGRCDAVTRGYGEAIREMTEERLVTIAY